MRILLAEDERSLSRALVTLLEKSNYSADAVYNGDDAVDYIKNGNYDAVILDIMMPGRDGISVLRTIRAEGNRVPVLMLTAKAEIDDKVLGLDSGANDYLTKPFSSRELLARIRSITRTQPQQTDSCLRFGSVSLDRASYELSGPGGCFRLSGKEFQIMEQLLGNPHQLISTERLLEKVWGYDTDVEQNVVWVYISYLRKKLTALDADIQIRAARGAGYMLEESK